MISSYKNPKQIKMNRRTPVYKQKKQNATILEILAVLLIIVIAIIIINPIVIKIRDEINKRQYIANVNTYIDKAIDMYGDDNYKDKFTKNNDIYTIMFSDIEGVNITKDPYGFNYKNDENYVQFNKTSEDIIVSVKSCATSEGIEYCYEIADVNTKDLDTNSIKTSIN